MKDGDIRVNTCDDGSTDARTGEQQIRQFDFMSPWEGAEYILPGDEKARDGAK